MGVFLLKIIFSTLSLLSNIVSRLIFTVTAYLLVIIIRGLRTPGEALQGLLEQVGSFVKACLEYVFEIVLETVSTLVSSSFDLVKAGVLVTVVGTGAAIAGLADKMKTSVYKLMEGVPEVVEGAVEMVSTMVTDLWNNYMDAKTYVTENA